MRQLVSVETISDIQSIPNADNIEVATVKGWRVVAKKGDFEVGDKAFYFEVDSWIPQKLAPFLCKEPIKTFQDIPGSLLKTIKLRGQISQGLLLPLKYVNDYLDSTAPHDEFASLSERLGVLKYEPPEIITTAGVGKPFPYFIQKTDQDRIQNLDISTLVGEYQVTEKLDGSSMTVFSEGVCSRNILLNPDDKSNFSRVAEELGLVESIKVFERNIAIQGELVGPGIQGNSYNLDKHKFFVFSIFDIELQDYWTPRMTAEFCIENDLTHVPSFGRFYITPETTLDILLSRADRKSTLNYKIDAEGLVFKSMHDSRSFKVISNKWLLKQK